MAVGQEAWTSRKYRTAWYLTALSTVALVGPFVASFLVSGACTELIDGAQWLTFLAVLWGTYFGANVAEKHGMFKQQTPTTRTPRPDPPEGD